MRFSLFTEQLKPSERINAWEQALRGSCVPLSVCAEPANETFCGAIVSRTVANAYISQVQASRHSAQHAESEISHTQGEFLLISFQLGGQGFLEQSHGVATVNPGELIVYDSEQAYKWVIPEAFKQIVVRIPKKYLRHSITIPKHGVTRSVSCLSGIGKVAFDHVSSVFAQAEALDAGDTQVLVDSSIELISRTVASAHEKQTLSYSNIQLLHLRQVYSFIDEHIRDPDLSPEMIAHHLGISVRYLHTIFHAEELSICRHILLKRLAGCARSLTQERLAGISVSSIAFAWGFNSAAHFSRIFRAEFGVSPREYRLGHSEAGRVC